MSSSGGFEAVRHMLARSRLDIDGCETGRTTFISHLGAVDKLLPGAWIAHRDLLYAMALSNLSPAQRSSLARAVLVEHEREFGVGRLLLRPISSGLPMGGSSLAVSQRGERSEDEEEFLYTWALGPAAKPRRCRWLLLRADPAWALDEAPRSLAPKGLQTLSELGGQCLLLVESATMAKQVEQHLGGLVELHAHPRFLPHLDAHVTGAALVLWPHDALDARGLMRMEPSTVVLVGAPQTVRDQCEKWLAGRDRKTEVVTATAPNRIQRNQLASFWRACGEPRVLLRGDPGWCHSGAAWLREMGASVALQSEATQLGLF